ncbi:metal-dependent hydrolase [Agromyces salentinus]|uniref:Metal-dependent hydrolase n=1 Tax=Agromyces salentinus TaxID=269421 RepID=A0ABN2MPW8_9MICO|nr:metal-dependent hydrolase [Agromyces salentinus]
MMGITHATSGAAAWIAVTSTMPVLGLGVYPLDPIGVLAGTAVAAGAALLPDADHHSATIAHSVPLVGRLVARTIGTLSGGHRQGAHSAIAVVLVAVAAWALTLITVAIDDTSSIAAGAGVGTAVLVCFGLKARDFVRSWPAAWALGAAAGAAIVVFAPEQVAWFPLAVTIGFVAHLAGDFLTTGGVPGVLWPQVLRPPERLRDTPVLNRLWLASGHVSLPLLGDTGSHREAALGAVLGLYCFANFAYESLRLIGFDLFPGA